MRRQGQLPLPPRLLNGEMEAFVDAVGLRMPRLTTRSRMVGIGAVEVTV